MKIEKFHSEFQMINAHEIQINFFNILHFLIGTKNYHLHHCCILGYISQIRLHIGITSLVAQSSVTIMSNVPKLLITMDYLISTLDSSRTTPVNLRFMTYNTFQYWIHDITSRLDFLFSHVQWNFLRTRPYEHIDDNSSTSDSGREIGSFSNRGHL